MLLTRMSSRTRIEGRWTLPGGGIDHGEDPRERCGARSSRRPACTSSRRRARRALPHFTGPRPDGRVEDYHGIHLIFEATVLPASEGVEPHVVEVDGSTDLAAGCRAARPLGLDLLSAARHALTSVGTILD